MYWVLLIHTPSMQTPWSGLGSGSHPMLETSLPVLLDLHGSHETLVLLTWRLDDSSTILVIY